MSLSDQSHTAVTGANEVKPSEPPGELWEEKVGLGCTHTDSSDCQAESQNWSICDKQRDFSNPPHHPAQCDRRTGR